MASLPGETMVGAGDREVARLIAGLPGHLVPRCRIMPRARVNRSTVVTPPPSSPILYWTHHALRVDENPALDVAIQLANALRRPLLVYQGLSQSYRYASDRHHLFQLQAACDLANAYQKLGIRYSLHLERGKNPPPSLLQLARSTDILITDDFPGEPTERWAKRLAMLPYLTIIAVDTACVVPMQLVGRAYDRAFAFRDATKKWYAERVPMEWPTVHETPKIWDGSLPFPETLILEEDLDSVVAACDIDHSIPAVADTPGGTVAGYARWNDFLETKIHRYASGRNDPCRWVSSRMSAYLHYGMVSPMRLAREASRLNAEKYLEELLIWRELAYNYCFYRDDYTSVLTLPKWAIESLEAHRSDPRPAIYSWETLSRAKTEDRLWNACQLSLLRHGELHNNVRMTWGKAILKWTRNASEALALLIDLNHRYALDGRDPASYGGILWCLGQFDRPFEPEQPILGVVRDRPTQEHLQRIKIQAYETIVTRPISNFPAKIAIVGAGVAGAFCARTLADQGLDVELFDKSRGPSGRCATKRLSIEGSGILQGSSLGLDHGPPYLTLRDSKWGPWIQSWQDDGLIAPWHGTFVEIDSQGIRPAPREGVRWVGIPGLNRIGRKLVEGLTVNYESTIAKATEENGRWLLELDPKATVKSDTLARSLATSSSSRSNRFGPFDIVLWSTPPQQLLPLVPASCNWYGDLSSHEMSPCWALMLVLERRWELPFDGARVFESEISWMGRESSKPKRSSDLDCWVIHASPEWSRSNLELDPDGACQRLLASLQRSQTIEMPPVIHSVAHRWRYAQPRWLTDRSVTSRSTQPMRLAPTVTSHCFWDPANRMGACGDWLAPDGIAGGIEGAMSSGVALAGRVLRWLTKHGAWVATGSADRGSSGGFKQMELFE
ncbi:MAG: NAD(P)-binding protein [Pirellula sp.]